MPTALTPFATLARRLRRRKDAAVAPEPPMEDPRAARMHEAREAVRVAAAVPTGKPERPA